MVKIKKYNYKRQFILQEGGKAELPETLAARAEAFSEGKEAGIKETQDNLYNIILKIHNETTQINHVQQDGYQYITRDILVCTQTIIQKLLPYLQEKYLNQEITYFVKQSLSFLKSSGVLTITVHPQNLDKLKTKLQDMPGHIEFTEDKSLDKSDCRISWDEGGIEKITSGVATYIEQAMEDLKQGLPERRTAQENWVAASQTERETDNE